MSPGVEMSCVCVCTKRVCVCDTELVCKAMRLAFSSQSPDQRHFPFLYSYSLSTPHATKKCIEKLNKSEKQ